MKRYLTVQAKQISKIVNYYHMTALTTIYVFCHDAAIIRKT